MLRHLKAMLIFARYQARATGVDWQKGDAASLAHFLTTQAGVKLTAYLGDVILRQQSNALSNSGDLRFEAGYCNGQKGLIASIESLADTTKFPDEGLDDTDLHLNP